MTFTDEAYKDLVELLGEEYVSRDPFVMQAYSRCFTSRSMRAPKCVVLPKEITEIQEIYKLANKHGFKLIPTGTNLISMSQPTSGEFDYVTIDPKRMDGLWIDEENMTAVVEPYVTFARLQTEAMKRGLTCYIPSGGSQTSVLANLVFQGFNMQSYRLGAGSRSMLAMEWVMPTGEIMRTGSASQLDGDFFWGEGPGPDLRGMIKGTGGFCGGIGMCTRIGIKLFPWVGPERFPCEGATPDKRCRLPEDRFRIFLIDFPSLDDVINAMYEIGRNEIASRCIHFRKGWLPAEGSLSQEDFWDMWESGEYQASVNNMLTVVLEAHVSEKQLDYEEEILREIAAENNGRFITGELHEKTSTILAPDLLYRPNLIFRGFRVAGTFISVKLALDSLDHAALILRNGTRLSNWFIKDKIPPFVDDEGETGYISPYDLSHMAHYELPVLYEADFKNVMTAGKLLALQMLEDIRSRTHPGGFLMSFFIDLMGPWMGGFHKIMREVKKTFDPNNVSNPPWPFGSWVGPLKNTLRKYLTYARISKRGAKENV